MLDLNAIGAFGFLVKTLFDLYSFCVLARIILQLVKADFYNPVCQFVVKATQPFLQPLHRLLPVKPVDFAAIILLVVVQLLKIILLAAMAGGFVLSIENLPVLLAMSAVSCVSLVLDFFVFTIFISVIASWLMPGGYHPMMALLHQVTEPLLGPVRRILPAMGGLDLAPMVVLMALYFLKILLGV